MIVLNPFLDSLCNSAFKNIGLALGIPNTCFQHPQDIVIYIFSYSPHVFTKMNSNSERRMSVMYSPFISGNIEFDEGRRLEISSRKRSRGYV